MSAAAVVAVRLGFRAAFSWASFPATGEMRFVGQPATAVTGPASAGLSNVVPVKTPIAPAAMRATVGAVASPPNNPKPPATRPPIPVAAPRRIDRLPDCSALNAPSRSAAMRLGLSYEGVFRQAQIVKRQNRDTAWYAAIDSEWPAIGRAMETWLDPANFDAEGRQKQSLSALTKPILVNVG